MATVAMTALLAAAACSSSGSVGQSGSTGSGGPDAAAMASRRPSSPSDWCMRSPEPYRCRGRAAMEHDMCMDSSGSYDSCRFALDQMHGQ